MHTHTNVVHSLFLNCSTTLLTTSRSSVTFAAIPAIKSGAPIAAAIGAITPANLSCSSITFASIFSISAGNPSIRTVCPVGAVSKTTTSCRIFCTDCISAPNATASSAPGTIFASRPSPPPAAPPAAPNISSTIARTSGGASIASIAALGSGAPPGASGSRPDTSTESMSISIAERLGTPGIGVGDEPIFVAKASERLWAGSVEMRRTEARAEARARAREEETVVLPTPPLPPTKTQRSESWERTLWREGGSAVGMAEVGRASHR